MKVIKPGKPIESYDFTIEEIATLKCERCGCECEYTQSDCRKELDAFIIRYDWIIDCPNCGESYITFWR